MEWKEGISLRDYFAAAALTGYLAYSPSDSETMAAEDMAKIAYQHADAMIAARDK